MSRHWQCVSTLTYPNLNITTQIKKSIVYHSLLHKQFSASVELVNGQGRGVWDVVGLSDPFSSFPVERKLSSIFHPSRRADSRPGLSSSLFSLDTKARKKIKRRTPPPQNHTSKSHYAAYCIKLMSLVREKEGETQKKNQGEPMEEAHSHPSV